MKDFKITGRSLTEAFTCLLNRYKFDIELQKTDPEKAEVLLMRYAEVGSIMMCMEHDCRCLWHEYCDWAGLRYDHVNEYMEKLFE